MSENLKRKHKLACWHGEAIRLRKEVERLKEVIKNRPVQFAIGCNMDTAELLVELDTYKQRNKELQVELDSYREQLEYLTGLRGAK